MISNLKGDINMKKLKIVPALFLTLVLTFLPFQYANAATYSTSETPSYVFQNTDGEWDVVYCTGNLFQDYNLSTSYITYTTRQQYFGIKEVGCGGVNIWLIEGANIKNSSGTTVKSFTDWVNNPVIVESGVSVLLAKKSTQSVSYILNSGYKLAFNYTIGGNEFYIIPAISYSGSVSLNLN